MQVSERTGLAAKIHIASGFMYLVVLYSMLFTGKSREGATNTLVTTLNAVRLDLSYPIFADGAKIN